MKRFLAISAFLFSSVLFAQQEIDSHTVKLDLAYPPVTAEQQVKIDKIDKKAGDQKMRLQAIEWKWQQKLELTDFHILLVTVPLEELPLGAVGASGILVPEHKVAVILVLDAGEYTRIDEAMAAAGLKMMPGEKPTPTTLKEIKKDQENTVIHELMHLAMNNKTPEEEEHHVKAISGLLQKGK
jgi:hypothetical protein